MSAEPVLRVSDLAISYRVNGHWLRAVDGVRLSIAAGEIAGLVGESGSGKSTVATGVLRYLPANGRVEPHSQIALAGDDLRRALRRAMRRIWGARMGFVRRIRALRSTHRCRSESRSRKCCAATKG